MSLFVRESGPVSAPTIVLLHGGGVSGWSWQPQIEAFPDYHLLVPDLPEHGRSMAESPFTLPDAAARVANLIRDRGHGGRAHVIGLSLGAQTAIQLLAAVPEVVDHTLLSGALVRGLPGASLVRPTIAVYMPFRNIPTLVRANMRFSAIPAAYYQPFSEDTRALTAGALTHVLVAKMTFRLPPGLDRVKAAVLVTVGSREYGMLFGSARDVVAAIPGAVGCVVRGAPHNWPLAAPALFNWTTRAWIEGRALPDDLRPLTSTSPWR
jgi:pimeloyl-ACP methyl ester carboxylesterase